MTESFWWHLLAGFIIGFGVSTVWEWLYFRRKRTALRDRYVAELEAAVRTYAAQMDAVTAGAWSEPHFEKPPIFLETEESLLKEHPSKGKPLPTSPFAAQASPSQAASNRVDKGAISTPSAKTASIQPDRRETTPAESAREPVHSEAATPPLRSVAVQSPPSTTDRSQTLEATQIERDPRSSSTYRASTETPQRFVEAEPPRHFVPFASSHLSADAHLAERAPSRPAEPAASTFPRRQQHANLEYSDLPEAAQATRNAPASFSASQERSRSAEAMSVETMSVEPVSGERAETADASQQPKHSTLAGGEQTKADQSERSQPAPSSPQKHPSLAEAAQPGRAETPPLPFAAMHLERAGATHAEERQLEKTPSPGGEGQDSTYFVFPGVHPASFEAARDRTEQEITEQVRPLQKPFRQEPSPSGEEHVEAPQRQAQPLAGADRPPQPAPSTTSPEISKDGVSTEDATPQRDPVKQTGAQTAHTTGATVSTLREERTVSLSSQASIRQHEEDISPAARHAARHDARHGNVYTAVITSRTEWMLLRIVQAMVQFVRQVRSAIAGEDVPQATLWAAKNAARCEDDLTRIPGLTPAHAERLKSMGIRQYSQVAALTVDELQRLTFTSDVTKPVNYEQWRKDAAALASQKRGEG